MVLLIPLEVKAGEVWETSSCTYFTVEEVTKDYIEITEVSRGKTVRVTPLEFIRKLEKVTSYEN